MANDLTKNPWIIDTAAATILSTDLLLVEKFRWEGATTAGHALAVQDQNGRVIFESFAAGSNFIDDTTWLGKKSATEFRCNGLKVPTLASGKLKVYLK